MTLITLLLLAVFVFAACSDRGDGGDAATGTAGQRPPTGQPNRYGWIVPEETLTFSVFTGVGDMTSFLADEFGGKALKDGWLLENMNVVVDRRIMGTDMVTQLNLMLASNDYPEVLTNMPIDMANRFAQQGRAFNLTDHMDTWAPDIMRRMGEFVNMLRDENGQLFVLAQNWGENPNVAGWDFGIRYDLWRQLNLPLYTTPYEYFDTLQALLAFHPTNEAGERSYALGSAGDQGRNLLTTPLTAYGFTSDRYRHNPDGTFSYWLRTDEGRQVARYMNRMWRYDMIHPDYLSMTYSDYIAHLSNHRIIGNMSQWWHGFVGGHEIWSVENPDWVTQERFMSVSLAWPGIPKDQTRLITSNFIGSTRAIISDRTDQPLDILRFINWQNTELGNKIAGWGPPMQSNNWDIAADGMWVIDEAILNIDQKNIFYHDVRRRHGAHIYNIALNANWLYSDGRSNFDMIDPRVSRVSIWDYWPVNPDGSFSDEGLRIAWGNYTAPPFNIVLYAISWDPEDPVTWARQSILETELVWWAEIVTASSEAESMAAFDRALQHAISLGLAGVEEFMQTQYEANRALLGR
jgi:ABC-type glycerol-3-phosphate transport system substrate-binding protein